MKLLVELSVMLGYSDFIVCNKFHLFMHKCEKKNFNEKENYTIKNLRHALINTDMISLKRVK